MLKVLPIVALSLILFPVSGFAQHAATYPSVDSAPSAGTGPNAAPSTSRSGGRAQDSTGANAQTCTDSCNRSYEVCMDQDSAIPGNDETLRNSNNAASNLIGGQSDCKDHLSSCLNTCGG